MKNKEKITIFLVDDDPIFQKMLEIEFTEQTQYDIKTFSTGEDCLKNLFQKPDVIFLDYQLNSLSPKAQTGLQILNKIKATNPKTEVVMLSSQDQIEVAVNCLKHHAFDYIIKSESAFIRAQKSIAVILNQKRMNKELIFFRTTSILLSIAVILAVVVATVMQIYHPGLMK
jgi:two-component system OmpR family response regulator